MIFWKMTQRPVGGGMLRRLHSVLSLIYGLAKLRMLAQLLRCIDKERDRYEI